MWRPGCDALLWMDGSGFQLLIKTDLYPATALLFFALPLLSFSLCCSHYVFHLQRARLLLARSLHTSCFTVHFQSQVKVSPPPSSRL